MRSNLYSSISPPYPQSFNPGKPVCRRGANGDLGVEAPGSLGRLEGEDVPALWRSLDALHCPRRPHLLACTTHQKRSIGQHAKTKYVRPVTGTPRFISITGGGAKGYARKQTVCPGVAEGSRSPVKQRDLTRDFVPP